LAIIKQLGDVNREIFYYYFQILIVIFLEHASSYYWEFRGHHNLIKFFHYFLEGCFVGSKMDKVLGNQFFLFKGYYY
jgi:hypothetical protein